MGLADGWYMQERELVRRGPASAKGGCERSERDRVKVRNVGVRARPDRRGRRRDRVRAAWCDCKGACRATGREPHVVAVGCLFLVWGRWRPRVLWM